MYRCSPPPAPPLSLHLQTLTNINANGSPASSFGVDTSVPAVAALQLPHQPPNDVGLAGVHPQNQELSQGPTDVEVGTGRSGDAIESKVEQHPNDSATSNPPISSTASPSGTSSRPAPPRPTPTFAPAHEGSSPSSPSTPPVDSKREPANTPIDKLDDVIKELKEPNNNIEFMDSLHLSLFSAFRAQSNQLRKNHDRTMNDMAAALLKLRETDLQVHQFSERDKILEERGTAINTIIDGYNHLKERDCGEKIRAFAVLFLGAVLFAGFVALMCVTAGSMGAISVGLFASLSAYSTQLALAANIIGLVGALVTPLVTEKAFKAGFFCSKPPTAKCGEGIEESFYNYLEAFARGK